MQTFSNKIQVKGWCRVKENLFLLIMFIYIEKVSFPQIKVKKRKENVSVGVKNK